jgi:hypothetical protein
MLLAGREDWLPEPPHWPILNEDVVIARGSDKVETGPVSMKIVVLKTI